jgi:para-aminobenzoate synthetase component 1
MSASAVATLVTARTPEALGAAFLPGEGVLVLRSARFDLPQARYSFVAARPFLTFRSTGSRCEIRRRDGASEVLFGNPWRVLGALLARYELPDEADVPFPLGGAFGFWGYGLGAFVEPTARPSAIRGLPIPDCALGFHDSLVVFDHHLGKTHIIATGMQPDGSRDPGKARAAAEDWRIRLESESTPGEPAAEEDREPREHPTLLRSMDREAFCAAVERAQRYIRAGDIYQVNLSCRIGAPLFTTPWAHWRRLMERSPAPFGAYFDFGDFQLASVSPELFLRMSGPHAITRPIKGTRPRGRDEQEDARLSFELQTSPKEIAELVMITDLLRNDLGRVCDFGTVQTPDLLRLEQYAQVQHLVSTVEGRLRPGLTHLDCLEACFPGGSITGAPKVRAMQIIDELEPVARGPYTGCAGYLGFNRESQLSILIRASILHDGMAWHHAGAGIVADSDPAAEYEETEVKAAAFLAQTSERARDVPAPPRGMPRLTPHARLAEQLPDP